MCCHVDENFSPSGGTGSGQSDVRLIQKQRSSIKQLVETPEHVVQRAFWEDGVVYARSLRPSVATCGYEHLKHGWWDRATTF